MAYLYVKNAITRPPTCQCYQTLNWRVLSFNNPAVKLVLRLFVDPTAHAPMRNKEKLLALLPARDAHDAEGITLIASMLSEEGMNAFIHERPCAGKESKTSCSQNTTRNLEKQQKPRGA